MFRGGRVFRNRKLMGYVFLALEEQFSEKSKVDRYPTSD